MRDRALDFSIFDLKLVMSLVLSWLEPRNVRSV